MRTDDLIRTLVADAQAPATPHATQAPLVLAAGAALSVAGFMVVLGPRPDIVSALATVRFDAKVAIMVLLLTATIATAWRLARPGAAVGRAATLLAAVPVLWLMAVAAELVATPSTQWTALAVGSNALVCLTAIPLLAAPMLVALIFALRGAAPTRPVTAGFVAGLLAGAAGAVLYALQCDDDSPLFVALWYSAAFAITSLAGALAGRKWLRW